MAAALPAAGVTAFCPTLVSRDDGGYARAARALAAAAGRPASARMLGPHLEGPFLAPTRHGAHDPALLRAPDPETVDRLLAAFRPAIVTLAPELEGALPAIRRIRRGRRGGRRGAHRGRRRDRPGGHRRRGGAADPCPERHARPRQPRAVGAGRLPGAPPRPRVTHLRRRARGAGGRGDRGPGGREAAGAGERRGGGGRGAAGRLPARGADDHLRRRARHGRRTARRQRPGHRPRPGDAASPRASRAAPRCRPPSTRPAGCSGCRRRSRPAPRPTWWCSTPTWCRASPWSAAASPSPIPTCPSRSRRGRSGGGSGPGGGGGCRPARRSPGWRPRAPSPPEASASTRPQGSTTMLCPCEAVPSAWRPTCPGAITKAWFSIARARRRGSQWARPVTSVKAAGTTRISAPRQREPAVQLREAQVVADRHPDPAPEDVARRRPRSPAPWRPTRGRRGRRR